MADTRCHVRTTHAPMFPCAATHEVPAPAVTPGTRPPRAQARASASVATRPGCAPGRGSAATDSGMGCERVEWSWGRGVPMASV